MCVKKKVRMKRGKNKKKEKWEKNKILNERRKKKDK